MGKSTCAQCSEQVHWGYLAPAAPKCLLAHLQKGQEDTWAARASGLVDGWDPTIAVLCAALGLEELMPLSGRTSSHSQNSTGLWGRHLAATAAPARRDPLCVACLKDFRSSVNETASA